MMGPSVLVSGLVAIGLGINAYEDWKSQTIRVDVALLTLGLALVVMTGEALAGGLGLGWVWEVLLAPRLLGGIVGGLLLVLFWFASAGRFGLGDAVVLTANGFILMWPEWIAQTLVSCFLAIVYLAVHSGRKIEKWGKRGTAFVPFVWIAFVITRIVVLFGGVRIEFPL